MELQGYGVKNVTADSCFGLVWPHQCSAALSGPDASTVDLRVRVRHHQGALNKPGVLAKQGHNSVHLPLPAQIGC